MRDTGIGIDPTLLPDLFEVFVQGVRGPDRAPGGLGIGLSLVRHLTELHGGTVTAQSEGLGRGERVHGATAGGRVASTDRTLQSDSTGPPPAAGATSTRVLIVDDHRDVVKGLSRLLSITGYDVRAALSPAEALELAGGISTAGGDSGHRAAGDGRLQAGRGDSVATARVVASTDRA